jgi:hypothetical protein
MEVRLAMVAMEMETVVMSVAAVARMESAMPAAVARAEGAMAMAVETVVVSVAGAGMGVMATVEEATVEGAMATAVETVVVLAVGVMKAVSVVGRAGWKVVAEVVQ